MLEVIKPIETVYNGYRFRSRLEARWAVFFDAAGIPYQYEPEGFELADRTKYLPDFYLPKLDIYCEVKPNRPGAIEEILKAREMIKWGSPIQRIIILADIPGECKDGGLWHFPCFYYDASYQHRDCISSGWYFFYDAHDESETVTGNISGARNYRKPYRKEFKYGKKSEPGKFVEVLEIDAVSDTVLKKRAFCNDLDADIEMQLDMNPITFKSFAKARQARFEHGEKGG